MKEFLAQWMPEDASKHGPAIDNLNAAVHWLMLVLFVFWLAQFVVPSWREEMVVVYLIWCALEIAKLLLQRQIPPAWTGLRETLARRFA